MTNSINITFKDLMSTYMNHFSGRVLTIVTDCNFSGSWVRDCMQYLDEIGVTPCGHSGVKNDVLVKVFASCHLFWHFSRCTYVSLSNVLLSMYELHTRSSVTSVSIAAM